MTSKNLKIKLWLQEHKKIIWLISISCIAAFGVVLQNKVKFPQVEISPETIGVVGTLLGAVVGGIFSLAGSVWVARMQQKAQREVLKKNIIYKPLYDELIKNDRLLKQENPYPRIMRSNNERSSFETALEFCIWTKIKDDSRFLETPKSISEKMIELQQIAEDFMTIKKVAIAEINKCWKESLTKFDIEPDCYSSMDEWELSIILEPDKNCALEKLNHRLNGLNKNYDTNILKDFNESCRNNYRVIEVYNIRILYMEKQTKMIELLTMYIKYIDLRYEG